VSFNIAANGGDYRYGSPESYALWAESAAGAVLNEYFGKQGKVSVLKGTEDYMRKLLKNVPADQIKYINPQVFKYAKWAQFAGFTGDIANLTLIGTNIGKDGLTVRNGFDAAFGIIGVFPIAGDAVALFYSAGTSWLDYTNTMSKKDPDGFIRQCQIMNMCYCFAEGSLVAMADGSFKSIESVQIGDSVITFNFENQELEMNPVLHVDALVHHELVKVVFSNGKEIISTEDHPYFVKGKGWCSFNPQQTQKNYNIQTRQLEASDFCLTIKKNKLKKVKILQIEPLEKSLKTYNLTRIGNSNNYFVNGILVNNENNLKL
jgi:hypothetical protein